MRGGVLCNVLVLRQAPTYTRKIVPACNTSLRRAATIPGSLTGLGDQLLQPSRRSVPLDGEVREIYSLRGIDLNPPG